MLLGVDVGPVGSIESTARRWCLLRLGAPGRTESPGTCSSSALGLGRRARTRRRPRAWCGDCLAARRGRTPAAGKMPMPERLEDRSVLDGSCRPVEL